MDPEIVDSEICRADSLRQARLSRSARAVTMEAMDPDVVDPNTTEPRIDWSSFSVARLTDPDDALAYWLSRPIEERLQALELLRRTFHGYTEADARLQRVLEVAKLEPR
jgi:hypothetical protein